MTTGETLYADHEATQLVEAQAPVAGLPLTPVMLPYPCTNQIYEEATTYCCGVFRFLALTISVKLRS